MNDQKTQIVEKLKSASNILVTVSMDPSVDQLAACIAMTLLLNKFKKNATAVFSGKVPSVLGFLKPDETIETTTDSLRDFIIALDKSKADKLRYKVEDDVVKIFITPYKTSITEDDLKYSAGDFNVDVIVALGVHHQQDLDSAILAHGRIFHDAVTVSINNTAKGDLGEANWEDLEASSLSELVADLVADLDPALLDAEVATALLTGIVAETSRFSNNHTHPRTLNVSSKLLEAGADQELVNKQLQDLIGVVVNLDAGNETASEAASAASADVQEAEVVPAPQDELVVSLPAQTPEDKPAAEAAPAASADAAPEAETVDDAPTPIEAMLGTDVDPTPAPILDQLAQDEAAVSAELIGIEPADDADAARQAVDDALGAGGGQPAETQPVEQPAAAQPIEDLPAQPLQPLSFPEQNPLIQPITPNQPSYASPATTTQYDAPLAPVNEPAPLVMSPADQPFTMPMPPTSSMPQPTLTLPPQPPAFQPYPSQAIGQPDSQPAATGSVPPPLPPPMTPGQ